MPERWRILSTFRRSSSKEREKPRNWKSDKFLRLSRERMFSFFWGNLSWFRAAGRKALSQCTSGRLFKIA
jgi:hypothetical protein